MNKMSEIMNMYTKRKVKENNNIPVVNAEALNRILVESDDEGKHYNVFVGLKVFIRKQ
jgi:hypothetical protein